MKEKLKNFLPIILTIIIFLLVFLILSSCEKEHNHNTCANVFETFQDSDYYYDYYYNKCKNISDNENEIENCVDNMVLTTKEIDKFCNIYIELNDDYNNYREY